VTLDRVVNVSQGWERLLELAAARAGRLLGLVYPRDTRFVRLVIAAMNLSFRLRGKPVRAFVRPPEEIARITGASGLVLDSSHDVGPAWQVAVYRRE
jgi:hypothetical protein